jgi:hypothetical protein
MIDFHGPNMTFKILGDSHFWVGLMVTKKYFFPYGSFSIRDGSEIRF